MCGVAGVWALGDRPPDPAWGPTLVRCLSHRGPDGDGVYCDRRVLLAHTRLAIIDLTDTGRQPMESGDGRHTLAINGEIYNHEALRPGLEAEGVRFRGRADTETLVELLAHRGVAGLADVRGMFAFAWYDRTRASLVLVRDRLGKRPLYWIRTRDYVAFASEVRALLALPFVPRRLDPATVSDYLGYLYVPGPRTALEGVCRVVPGSALRLGDESSPGAIAEERWWRLPRPDPAARPDAEWLRSLDASLLESVRLRTVSDVPIGVFLSGGIDSSLVLERLRAAGQRPIRTFTVGFRGLLDERPIARESARRFSDDHVELEVEPASEPEVESALACFGEPLGDSAIVTTWLISRAASRHVKVVLNGDGGDELFGGYPRYPFARRLDVARRIPGALALLSARDRGRPQLEAVFEAAGRGRIGAAARALSRVTPDRARARLLRAGLMPEDGGDEDRWGEVADALYAWDSGVYLPDDLMIKADHAAMAHALENRSPLLDHTLFERVWSLPVSRRTGLRVTKPLLRRLAAGRIPDAALAAPKTGFQLPLETWLRGPLAGWLDRHTRRAEATRALYRDGAVAGELQAFASGRSDELAAYRLWGIAALEFWARTFGIEVPA